MNLANAVGHLGRPIVITIIVAMLVSCVSAPPRNVDNVCKIFSEKRSWYRQAEKAAARWQSSVPIIMAIMHQESRFVANAKPPRKKILWVLPGFRASNAYGYSQAKTETWRWYVRDSGRRGAKRKDFGDSTDFIGWYNRQSTRIAKIAPTDAYALYLAYHEGHGGYQRGTYRNKTWLKNVALKVQRRAALYQTQLNSCKAQLQKRRWWFFG